jgi:hypothetical protein
MIEYKVVEMSTTAAASMEIRLNALARDGWIVVCACSNQWIIMSRTIDFGKSLAEEVLRRQFTYSLPGMEEQDAETA